MERECFGRGYEDGALGHFSESHRLTAVVCAEVPKWTRVSQRINPPGF